MHLQKQSRTIVTAAVHTLATLVYAQRDVLDSHVFWIFCVSKRQTPTDTISICLDIFDLFPNVLAWRRPYGEDSSSKGTTEFEICQSLIV